ncbi:hypothetical protein CHS0354_015175 [Potamilus streckersoni]|uniref:G-protein coupled receptors family 1 profile domain-containing protein n=1 Tax=Potamilus streckersoni TaxID=2493646 RepID=A0AAE0SCT0_9BIVA|nr:hypothetical protein CHS0354_015175 [Potamilus streckersoni]
MSVNENKTILLIDIADRNVSQFYFKFEMPNYIFILYTLYLAGSMTIGVPGNSIILAIYYKHKPSTNVDCYILSIAVLDLVCLVVTVPIYILIQTNIWDVININSLCKALNFTGQIVTFAESFLLCVMAAERFLKVCRPKSQISLDRRGKYIVLSIILSTIVISVPNLLFSWIDYRRSCIPVTNPPSLASAFFLLSVSLFIIMFGIVSFCYASVAKTLFQSAMNTAQYSTTSRKIIQRNKINPLSYQTDLMPTTSFKIDQLTTETSLSMQTNVTSIQNAAINVSLNQVTGEAICFGKEDSNRDNINLDVTKDNKNYGNDLIVLRKPAKSTYHISGIHADDMTQVEHITANVTPREQLVPDSIENMSLPQKKRLFRTTKVSFLITITFIISWLPEPYQIIQRTAMAADC